MNRNRRYSDLLAESRRSKRETLADLVVALIALTIVIGFLVYWGRHGW